MQIFQKIQGIFRFSYYGAVVGALALSACAETQLAAHAFKRASGFDYSSVAATDKGKPFKLGAPYQIAGRWYVPQIEMGYDKTGIASWYGPNFHGKLTANGEVYNKYAMTAAHKTLPLPSVVRVTNLENGKKIVLRINDRGPFVGNRIIDLSYAAAKKIEMDKKGLAKVRVEVLQAETLALYEAVPGSPTVASLFPKPASKPQAYVSANFQPEIKPEPASIAAAVNSVIQVPKAKAPQPQKGISAVASAPAYDNDAYYVQTGSFIDYNNAQRMKLELAEVTSADNVLVKPVNINGQSYFRVQVGPFQDAGQASKKLSSVLSAGNSNAKIISE